MRKYWKGSTLVVLIALVALAAAVSAFGSSTAASATTVTVTAGKPSELKFPLSKKAILEGAGTSR